MAERSDEQLMLAFGQGEAAAFEVLVHRHRAAVFNFLLRFVRERTKAEDLLQETWLRIIRGSAGYKPRAKFSTWVYTIARNLCMDSVRAELMRKSDSLEEATSLADEGKTPEQHAEASSLRPLLEGALAQLPAAQREVFWLREYSGLSFQEIADVTASSESTVKSRMRYALEGLRRVLVAGGLQEALEGFKKEVG